MDPLSVAEAARERAEAEALLLLQRLPGLGDRRIGRLVARLGSGRAALAAGERAFADALARGEPDGRDRADGLRIAAARGAPSERAAVAELLDRADAMGARTVPLGSPAYPAPLLDLDDPPAVLFLRGRLELLAGPAVAVVGSRRASGYGRRTAARLAEALARAGVVVVSGLALGVDGEAHRAALAAAGGTIAVLGCGLDVVHPRAHAALRRDVLRHGLLAAEFPPGTLPAAHHFPRRNRIMAALARAVVVVEAAERSGALVTARHALDLGREVLAVPGRIDAPTSAGANALLRDGAHPALGAEEVLRAAGVDVVHTPAAAPAGADACAVWEALGAAPAGVDELAARSRLPAHRALAALALLELDGWAVQCEGARFARRA